MDYPITIGLVRHGQSEENLANALSRQGDDRMFVDMNFVGRPNFYHSLTDLGRQQALAAGEWFSRRIESGKLGFDVYYTSDYVRAKQTAGLLDLPDAEWKLESRLGEREFGELWPMTHGEREIFFHGLSLYSDFADHLAIPGRELRPWLQARVRDLLGKLRLKHGNQSVLLVTHAGVMWGFRIELEGLTQEEMYKIENSSSPYDKIHVGQVIVYTRQNPWSGDIEPDFCWMRSVYPWNPKLSENIWRSIKEETFSSEELLQCPHCAPV